MMNRLIWHHTGGGYAPNAVDRRAYHRLIDGEGDVHAGDFAIEASAPGRIQRGAHAAHTLNLNTGSIGLSVCAMVGGVWANPRASRAFPRAVQIDAMISETARLCLEFGIVPTDRTVLTHAEVEPTLGVKQRNKWDFDYDLRGFRALRDPIALGDELRQELAQALRGIGSVPMPPPLPVTRPLLRQGAVGDHVRELQRALGVTVDGQFGPATRAAVVAFQRRHSLLPDGIVGQMTWAALAC